MLNALKIKNAAPKDKPYKLFDGGGLFLLISPKGSKLWRLILTGVRDGAAVSLKLKHIDLIESEVIQDAREVNTKASKTIYTWFFPVAPELRECFERWVDYLREEALFGPDDPLFPQTAVGVGASRRFEPQGLKRAHWSTAAPIRKIAGDAFEAAGLPRFGPHSFRKTLVQLGERMCKTPEEFKAWSQNLGHEQVLTTFTSYGAVSRYRQAEILKSFSDPKHGERVVAGMSNRIY